MFVVITGLKGGAGKSTLAMHLAGELAKGRGPVLLIDADSRNRTATAWAARGPGLAFDVLDERQAARTGKAAVAASVVIDSQAAPEPDELRASVDGADLVLVPVVPDGIGLDSALRTLDVLGARPNVALVLTMCPPAPSRAAEDAREALAGTPARLMRAQVTRRAAFAHAGTRGVLVTDLPGAAAATAAAEITTLVQEMKRWRKETR